MLVVLWLVLLGLTAGCRVAPPVVKLGLVAPFEGRERPVGYDAIYAARLAVREVNASGRLGPYRVALAAVDDGGEAELAVQAAASLAADGDVAAVVGHWRPETTAAAREVYEAAGLPLITVGEPPFLPYDPLALPAEFRAAYAAVTPFEETAGPYSGPTYDAFYLLFSALELAESQGEINRGIVAAALEGLEYGGLTGTVHP